MSHVIARYVKSSHQNDPGRTVLEILLALLVINPSSIPTRADNGEKNLIQVSEKVCLLNTHVVTLTTDRKSKNSWMDGHQSPWVPHSLLKNGSTSRLYPLLPVQMDPCQNSPTRESRFSILRATTSRSSLATKSSNSALLRPLQNMVSVAVALLDSTAPLVRHHAVDLIQP